MFFHIHLSLDQVLSMKHSENIDDENFLSNLVKCEFSFGIKVDEQLVCAVGIEYTDKGRYISHIFTCENHRRMGYAAQLLGHVLSFGNQFPVYAMCVDVDSENLFTKFGFIEEPNFDPKETSFIQMVKRV